MPIEPAGNNDTPAPVAFVSSLATVEVPRPDPEAGQLSFGGSLFGTGGGIRNWEPSDSSTASSATISRLDPAVASTTRANSTVQRSSVAHNATIRDGGQDTGTAREASW